MQELQILSVARNIDSAQIRFTPFPGALDHRVYLESDPTHVKNAGAQWTPKGPIPCNVVEMNGLAPGESRLIVEALDMLGPMPPCAVLDRLGNAAYPCPCPGGVCSTMAFMNSGYTSDGNTTTNGQGDVSNKPNVLARSKVIVVTLDGKAPAGVDTFTSGAVDTISKDIKTGAASYSIKTDAGSYTYELQAADLTNSRIDVMERHLMPICVDGGTPGTNLPPHQGHGIGTIYDTRAFDLSQVIQASHEIDMEATSRKWHGIVISDAADPFTVFFTATATIPVNKSNTGFWVEFPLEVSQPTKLGVKVTQFCGYDKTGKPVTSKIVGALGQALHQAFIPQGRIDCRSKIDFAFDRKQFALYVDGALVCAYPWTQPLAWASARVGRSVWQYHVDVENVKGESEYRAWAGYDLKLWGKVWHLDNLRTITRAAFPAVQEIAAALPAWEAPVFGVRRYTLDAPGLAAFVADNPGGASAEAITAAFGL